MTYEQYEFNCRQIEAVAVTNETAAEQMQFALDKLYYGEEDNT